MADDILKVFLQGARDNILNLNSKSDDLRILLRQMKSGRKLYRAIYRDTTQGGLISRESVSSFEPKALI